MSDLIVIGLTGRARSGKDTASASLVALRGFHRIALADGIRAAFNDLSGPTGEFFKELTPEHTYRRALQMLGTEARIKADGDEIWVQLVQTKIAYAWGFHPAKRSRFVIPDIRYTFEANDIGCWVDDMGGRFECWSVERPGLDPIRESGHSSEEGVSEISIDMTIRNEGTIDDLSRRVIRAFDEEFA